jgi:uncharacterized protein YraI
MTLQHFRGIARLLFGLAVVAFAPAQLRADDAFQPYDVYVDQEEVTARCGPGGDYYRTDPLRHGQRLEVYLETGDGWLGVRPPEGSFCWVQADAVAADRSGKSGRVTEEGTLAWIGTHLGKARKYMWQVQLSKGEEVAILGRAEREGPDGPQTWYRIAPPAGEFRWVHRDQVVDSPEQLLRNKPSVDQRLAQGKPTPIDDGLIPPGEDPQPRPTAGAGLLSAAKSILLNGATEYGSPPTRPEVKAADLVPLDAGDAVPLAGAQIAQNPARSQPAPTIEPARPFAPAPETSGTMQTAFADETPAGYADEIAADPVQPIGSGIARATQPPLISIASEPLVRTIGAIADDQSSVQPASDANWVRGTGRGSIATQPASSRPMAARPGAATPGAGTGATMASASLPLSPQSSGVDESGFGPATSRSATTFAAASVDSLQLELSRRMVASARASEVEPLRIAAASIAQTHPSETERQRAKMLTQRIEQFQSVARRRDGEPAPQSLAAGGSPGAIPPGQVVLSGGGSATTEAVGFLVQVYSARPDSPPFALTDATGKTTHYVSPMPGLNLRRYLNQKLTVGGQVGYDTGLDTPHVIATSAVRSP